MLLFIEVLLFNGVVDILIHPSTGSECLGLPVDCIATILSKLDPQLVEKSALFQFTVTEDPAQYFQLEFE